MGGETFFESSPEMERILCDRLIDPNQPIAERFRTLFSIHNLCGSASRQALMLATRDSLNLLAHEAAFALGQMQDAEAIPVLLEILKDFTLHPIVRHEAADALGAIGLEDIIPQLEQSLVSDPAQEVRETCELALRCIEQQKTNCNGNGASPVEVSPFLSVDPAMPASHCSSVDQLRMQLISCNIKSLVDTRSCSVSIPPGPMKL